PLERLHIRFVLLLHPPRPTLFPYTTLFRSNAGVHRGFCLERLHLSREAFPRRGTRVRRGFRTWQPLLSAPYQQSRRRVRRPPEQDRKSTRLNSSHVSISYAVFSLNKKINLH